MSATLSIQPSESQPFISLPAFIDGRGPFAFVLDTGASISIITEELARTLEVKNVEVKEGLGAGGQKIAVSIGQADSIVVGEARVENAKLGIMKTLPKRIGDGVLGDDFLRHFVLAIDYKRSTLTLASPKDYNTHDKLSAGAMPLRLARPDRPIILRIR